jgi:hypothetical protein
MKSRSILVCALVAGLVGCREEPTTVIDAPNPAEEVSVSPTENREAPIMPPDMTDPVPPEMDGIIGYDALGNPIRVSKGNPYTTRSEYERMYLKMVRERHASQQKEAAIKDSFKGKP